MSCKATKDIIELKLVLQKIGCWYDRSDCNVLEDCHGIWKLFPHKPLCAKSLKYSLVYSIIFVHVQSKTQMFIIVILLGLPVCEVMRKEMTTQCEYCV